MLSRVEVQGGNYHVNPVAALLYGFTSHILGSRRSIRASLNPIRLSRHMGQSGCVNTVLLSAARSGSVRLVAARLFLGDRGYDNSWICVDGSKTRSTVYDHKIRVICECLHSDRNKKRH